MTVRVAPNLVPEIEQRLKAAVASAGFEGRLVVAADAALGPADCGIDWGDGGAERDMDGLWREIDAAIAELPARPDAAREPDADSEEIPSADAADTEEDRKSTRLKSKAPMRISFAVFFLEKKKQ